MYPQGTMHMIKKATSFFLFLLFLFLALTSCGATIVTPEPSSPTSPPNSSWSLPSDQDAPAATPAEDPKDGIKVRYTCEPANAGTISGKATQYIIPSGYTELITAMPHYGYEFIGWSDGCTNRSRTADKITEEQIFTAYFRKIEEAVELTVPRIYITTESGKPVSSKSYVDGKITIEGAELPMYNLENLSLQIKGRGNSSWDSATIGKTVGEERWFYRSKRYEEISETDVYTSKNSYTIKLSEKENLLGIGNGKNKDWILQSNKFDQTQLRNKFFYMLAERMGTLGWCTHCTWLELYVNGEYRGLYMLQEKAEASKDRVNVDDSGTDPDKGYLVELDFRVDKDSTKKEGIDWFIVPEFHKNDSNKREFDIVSDHSTPEECAFIQEYLIRVDAAIRTHDKTKIEEYVDIYSMVDIFIIEELGKDCDWGATSFYMAKDKGGKLRFTSPWDFDFTMGGYSSSISLSGIISHGTSGNEWFEELHDVSWFIEMVRARMNDLEDDFNDCLTMVRKYAMALKPYADKNNDLWKTFGTDYHEYVCSQVGGLLSTYDEHVGFAHDWALYRWEEMRKYYPGWSKSPFEA